MVKAGQLDQRITLQSYTLADDGAGGNVKTWADLSSTPNVWARVEARGGREAFSSDRIEATGRYVFTIRNRTDIDERMRVVWGGENYNLRAIFREGSRAMYVKMEAERGT